MNANNHSWDALTDEQLEIACGGNGRCGLPEMSRGDSGSCGKENKEGAFTDDHAAILADHHELPECASAHATGDDHDAPAADVQHVPTTPGEVSANALPEVLGHAMPTPDHAQAPTDHVDSSANALPEVVAHAVPSAADHALPVVDAGALLNALALPEVAAQVNALLAQVDQIAHTSLATSHGSSSATSAVDAKHDDGSNGSAWMSYDGNNSSSN